MDYKKLGNLYGLLGVTSNADDELIKSALDIQLRKAKDDDFAARLKLARGILLDKKKKQEYDDENGKLIGNYRVIRQIGGGGFGCSMA
ncbi:MAG: hypothetical protein ABIB71_08645 [Candidatus Woesearchaeota archaeon]